MTISMYFGVEHVLGRRRGKQKIAFLSLSLGAHMLACCLLWSTFVIGWCTDNVAVPLHRTVVNDTMVFSFGSFFESAYQTRNFAGA